MDLHQCFKEFIDYMISERNASPSTIRSYKTDYEIFITYLTDKGTKIESPDKVTLPVIRGYITYLKSDRNYAVRSIRRKIHSIKSFFNYLYKNEYIERNPTAAIHAPRAPQSLPKYLTLKEIQLVLRIIQERGAEHALRDKCMFATFCYSGIRRGELIALNWDDIDFGAKTLTVLHGKGDKQRKIPMPEQLAEDLWKYLQSRLPLNNKAVFIGESGTRILPPAIRNAFNRYFEAAGLGNKNLTIHSLRHSYATNLMSNGANLLSIQSLMGHADLNSTRIYTHLEMNQLRDEVEKLGY